jgi:ubiquinone biosynthesis accessory factor UbiK
MSALPFPPPPPFVTDAAKKLAAKLADVSSSAMSVNATADIKKNLGALFVAQMGKLQLVSREEFNIQSAALARAEAKLAALEAQLAALESRVEK